MMDHAAALEVAIDLIHLPSRTRVIRSAALPDGVPLLLRIAAGDQEAISEAIEWTGRSREVVREAAAFFIEQILLSSDADSYRVLGASPAASGGELRRNMALLLRWLHPDLDRDGERSIFAARVTLAWDDLKTQERRAAYDRSRGKLLAKKSPRRKKRSARTHPGNHASDKRLILGAHDGRHVGPGQLLDVRAEAPRGLLHRALLFLLGRPKYR
jgi:hypothetical protein